MDSGRRDELERRRQRMRYAESQVAAAKDLLGRGLPVGPDEQLAEEACRAALDALTDQQRFHLVWHRVWGVRLRLEMVAVARRLGELIGDEPVTLIWKSPASAPAAFAVSPRESLDALAVQIGPDPGDAHCDLVLVAGDGRSGLILTYDHKADADEYELRTWGQFNAVVDG